MNRRCDKRMDRAEQQQAQIGAGEQSDSHLMRVHNAPGLANNPSISGFTAGVVLSRHGRREQGARFAEL
jgi:hypothetical protein